MRAKSVYFLLFVLTLFKFNLFAQVDIKSINLIQATKGMYLLHVMFTDTIPAVEFLNGDSYKLLDLNGNKIELGEPERWIAKGDSGVNFSNVPVSYKDEYIFVFNDIQRKITKNNFQLRKGQKSFEDYENTKSIDWNWTATPKLIQNDSTNNSIGDLGLTLTLNSKLTNYLEFDFTGNISSRKSDPNNNLKLNLFWRPLDILTDENFTYGSRIVTICTQENTVQTLKYHDFSGRIFSTFFFRPFNGMQPLFLTAGYDYVFVKQIDKDLFKESRFHVQAQWGFVGLLGKGSGFFIDYHYWNKFSTTAEYNPENKKQRRFLSFELKVPIADDKSIIVQYADGDVAPTFESTTSVSLGLFISLNGLKILEPD